MFIGGVSDYMNKNNSISYNSEIDLPRKIEIAVKNYKKFNINQKETKQLVSEVYQIPKFKNVLKKIYKKDNENFDENIDLSELDRKLDCHKVIADKFESLEYTQIT